MAHCHHYFVQACRVLAKDPVCRPFLLFAAPLRSIFVSQSASDRVNYLRNSVTGDRRHLLQKDTMKDELIVGLLAPLITKATDIIHSAALNRSTAKKRRPLKRNRRVPANNASGDITAIEVVKQLAKQAKRQSKIFYRRVKHTLLTPPHTLHAPSTHQENQAHPLAKQSLEQQCNRPQTPNPPQWPTPPPPESPSFLPACASGPEEIPSPRRCTPIPLGRGA